MEFTATKISQGWVAPSGPTPLGVLELSAIDSLPALRRSVPLLQVFKHGPREGVGKVIREALSKALLYYYPLAGRLRLSDQNELQLVCSGDGGGGAWFVEASADCTLDDVNYFEDDTTIPYRKLLPPQDQNHEHRLDDPLVQLQVTQFGCSGFVVGTITCHSLIDGLATARFVQAVGEMARGADQPSIVPEWCRNFLPPQPPLIPSLIPITPTPTDDPYLVEFLAINVSLDKINKLKQEFRKWIGGTGRCSTFEMLSAVMWKARTRAIKPLTDQLVRLVFYVNCRPLFPQLPNGFYGNCFYPLCVSAPGGTLANMSVFQVLRLIKEAKAGLSIEFWKWTVMMDNPFERLAPVYTTLILTEWDGLGFKDADYGWGKPVNIIPVQESATVTPVVVVSSPSLNPIKGALRLRTWCVEKHHFQPLLQNIDNVIIDGNLRKPRL